MLPRDNRIPKKEIIPLLKRNGHRFRRYGTIDVLVKPRASGCPRIACVISKKSIPQSTQRHVFKRAVYAAFLGYRDILGPKDILIRPSKISPGEPRKSDVHFSTRIALKKLI